MLKLDYIATTVVEKGYVTREDLASEGISYDNLIEISKDKFVPKDLVEFEKVGLMELRRKNLPRAKTFLRMCYVCSPEGEIYNYYALYLDLLERKYTTISEYMRHLLASSNQRSEKFNLFVLYLVSSFVVLSKDLNEVVKIIDPKKLLEKDDNGTQSIRYCVAYWSFRKLDILLEKIEDKDTSIKEMLECFLVKSFVNTYVAFNKKIASLIKEGSEQSYDLANQMLFSKGQVRLLSPFEKRVLILVQDLRSMAVISQSEAMYYTPSEKFDDLLESRNYKRAREILVSGRAPISPSCKEGRFILYLLDKVIDLKERMIYTELFDSISGMTTLEKIDLYLKRENQIELKFYISKFINKQGYGEYQYLMDSLLELNSISQGAFSTAIMDYLTDMLNGVFKVDFETYKNNFKDSIQSMDIETARIYLNIIEEASSMGHLEIELDELNSLRTLLEQSFAGGIEGSKLKTGKVKKFRLRTIIDKMTCF